MNDNTQNKLDQATSARLGKLASKPVDTSHLAEHLQTLMRDVVQQDEPQTLRIPTWLRWRPMSAAAMILITVMLGLLVMQNTTQPVIAAPAGLAQIYHEVSGDMAEQMKVTSVEQANAMLAAQAKGAMPVPDLPGQMQSCCLHEHKGVTLTCVSLQRNGHLITVALADGKKLHCPEGETVIRVGREFCTHTVDKVNMVMAHKGDRWLCVMGSADMEELLAVAQGIAM